MITPNSLLAWRALMDKISKSGVGKFAGGASDMLLPEKASDLLTGPAYAVRHPLDSAQLLLRGAQDASQNQFEKMYAAPTTSEAIGHGLAGAIPMIGPAAGMAGEEIGTGNTARGLGMATALLAPSLYHGAKPIVSEATGLMEAVKRAKNINAIREANQAAKYDALANSARDANANAAATTPYPPMPDGPSGSLSQLRDDPNVRVPGLTDPYATSLPEPAAIDPLMGLPTRRDALKAGGAAALATAIGARAMESMGKAPEAAAVADPVLGRAAPSALGREGFYRELKHRVADSSESFINDRPTGTVIVDREHLPTNAVDGVEMNLDPSKRLFLLRAEQDNGKYLKDITQIPQDANLRQALREAFHSFDPDDIKRMVASEITPEAALRLNTIEKPKVPITMKAGARFVSVPEDITGVRFYLDESGSYTGNPVIRAFKGKRASVDEKRWINRGADLIPAEQALAMGQDTTTGHVRLDRDPRPRPNTIGISPRYTKRVSIRLLKDTMAAQIAENNRAAGKGIPPLLAKPPVLQDNPLLSRQDFFAGLRKK